jgi:titin
VDILDQALNNTIGGRDPGLGNLISGNTDGVFLSGPLNVGNSVQGNLIGTTFTGAAALPNTLGVVIQNGASNNEIGESSASNVIAFNTGAGVTVMSGVFNFISGNSIFANGGLGIDLGGDGVTPNTPGGPHTGPNHLQNFPVLQAAFSGAAGTTIRGTFNSTPTSGFYLEFYANAAPGPSGFGEGQTVVGALIVTTDGNGNASFTETIRTAVPVGQFITPPPPSPPATRVPTPRSSLGRCRSSSASPPPRSPRSAAG